MLRTQRLAAKALARAPRRAAGDDMALAATVALFGILPLLMVGGLLLAQVVNAIVR